MTEKIHKQMVEGGRIHYLDALKCLGIILVIEGHVWDYGMGIKVYDSLSRQMFYSFNMPIFFFVSGLLVYKAENLKKEICRKVFNKFVYLVIPAMLLFAIHSLFVGEDPTRFLKDGFGGYWFTITLWECFVIYYIITLLVGNSRVSDGIIVFLAILGVAILSIKEGLGPKLLDSNRLFKYFQYFVLGILAMKYRVIYEKIINSDYLKAAAILSFFILLFTIECEFWPKPIFHIIRDIVLRYLGTYIIVSWFACHAGLFTKHTKMNSVIAYLGKNSLAIYLLQYFFIPRFKNIDHLALFADEFTLHVIAFCYTGTILIACYVFISVLSNSVLIRKYILGRK